MNKTLTKFINIKTLFFLHGVITLAAGVVLVIDPNLIPNVVGIRLPSSAYLVSYLLGTAELCIAAVSFGASKFTDVRALRTTAWSFIILHGSTAIIEFYAYTQGLDALIWGNILLRVIVVILFAYFGLYKLPQKVK